MPNIQLNVLLPWLLGFIGSLIAMGEVRRRLLGPARAIATWALAAVAIFTFGMFAGKMGVALPQVASDSAHVRGLDVVKAGLAVLALSLVFYELRRAGQGRPIAERWKRFLGISMGVAGIILYFNSFKFGYPKYFHRWDQYHYYMGAKYFPEIGYDGLYKCSAIAQDDIGKVSVDVDDNGKPRTFDLRAEVRKSDKKIRNLGGDNLLMKVDELLENPQICKDRFTPERWEEYKKDVTFFSTQCYVDSYWTQMQQDHGYNPPPVWTLNGYYLGKWVPTSVRNMQALAAIDVLYLLGTFAIIYWAFGWRIFAVAGIFWGCQSSAPFLWTGGALLRQDWLFFFVAAACFARKRWFYLAGAALVYSALLRIFPGLAVVGWLIVAGIYVYRHKRMAPSHVKMLIGGTAAAAISIGASMAVVGTDSYQKFYKHTIEVHDQTPLTNHMGLRVIIGHDVGWDKESGRMRYTKDASKVDPFVGWKTARVQRYIDYKPVAYTVFATSLLASILVLRRIKSMWIAQAIGGIWIILGSQLTCYYYSYMLLLAVLSRMRRATEVFLLATAAISQLGWRTIGYNDDRYTYLTVISLVGSYVVMFMLAPKEIPNWDPRKSSLKWYDKMSGLRLGTLVSFPPGLVFAVMGAIRQDWSTVFLGALPMAAGIALWLQAEKLAKAPKPSTPDPAVGAKATVAYEAA